MLRRLPLQKSRLERILAQAVYLQVEGRVSEYCSCRDCLTRSGYRAMGTEVASMPNGNLTEFPDHNGGSRGSFSPDACSWRAWESTVRREPLRLRSLAHTPPGGIYDNDGVQDRWKMRMYPVGTRCLLRPACEMVQRCGGCVENAHDCAGTVAVGLSCNTVSTNRVGGCHDQAWRSGIDRVWTLVGAPRGAAGRASLGFRG
jgi:hypothetical protein